MAQFEKERFGIEDKLKLDTPIGEKLLWYNYLEGLKFNTYVAPVNFQISILHVRPLKVKIYYQRLWGLSSGGQLTCLFPHQFKL